MRKAAGIMLIIYGAASLYFSVGGIISEFRHIREAGLLILFLVVFFAFIVTGGVFCFKKKYWRICFASALLAVLMMIYWIYAFTRFRFPSPVLPPFLVWYPLLLMVTGILATIFVCIRKREWKEISHRLDCKVSYDG